MISGSCHCKRVQFEIHGELGKVTRCYCEDCRKLNGSAFAAVAATVTEDWRFISGEDHLMFYESTPGKQRAYCATCFSPLYAFFTKQPEVRRARLGTLNVPLGVGAVPAAHIFVADCADWYAVPNDGAPRFAAWPV